MLSILNTFTNIDDDNLNKYLINFIITIIIYIIIHYVLFSGIIKNNFINKFKYIFYAIVIGDLIYAKSIYDDKVNKLIFDKKEELNYTIYSKQELPNKIKQPKIIKPYMDNNYDNLTYQPYIIDNDKFNVSNISNNNPIINNKNNKPTINLQDIVNQTQVNNLPPINQDIPKKEEVQIPPQLPSNDQFINIQNNNKNKNNNDNQINNNQNNNNLINNEQINNNQNNNEQINNNQNNNEQINNNQNNNNQINNEQDNNNIINNNENNNNENNNNENNNENTKEITLPQNDEIKLSSIEEEKENNKDNKNEIEEILKLSDL